MDNHLFNSAFSRSREQGHFYAALVRNFCFLIITYSVFVQVKITDPFKTHSGIMWTFFVTTLVWTVVSTFETKLQCENSSHYKIVGNISLLSAILAIVSLVLLLIPILGWFIFVLWTIYFAMLARDLYQHFYPLLYNAVREVLDILNRLMTTRRGRMMEVEPNRLPV